MSSPPAETRPTLSPPLAFGRDLALATLVGGLAGTAGAGFLRSLDAVTSARFAHPWLLALLPLAGLLMAWMYRSVGSAGRAERGTNLIIEEIHEPGGGVPLRMAPLVLGATLLTHLCGGSAGREGTAVQMGGALAGWLKSALRLGAEHQGMLLSAGVAAGFGAVFGAPLAGAVFAVEVLIRGRIHHRWLGTCLTAALTGDLVCRALGGHHADYRALAGLDALSAGPAGAALARAAAAGVLCGLASRLFVAATHFVKGELSLRVSSWWLRPVLGGLAVGGLAMLLRDDAYLGLGAWSPDPADPTLLTVFQAGGATPWSWLWKLVFTALTLGAGFKGGEVTPLFFIGAMLGHAAAPWLGLPVALAAALGFVALFAGASKTPLACTLLAVELFGGEHAALFAVACLAAYLSAGADGIYAAQRRGLTTPGETTDRRTGRLRRRRPFVGDSDDGTGRQRDGGTAIRANDQHGADGSHRANAGDRRETLVLTRVGDEDGGVGQRRESLREPIGEGLALGADRDVDGGLIGPGGPGGGKGKGDGGNKRGERGKAKAWGVHARP